MSDRDAQHLRNLLEGGEEPRIVVGELPERPERPGHIALTDEWQTIQLIEEHYIGQDRFPVRHDTTQTIIVQAETLSCYPVRFGTDEIASFMVLRGGQCGGLTRIDDNLYEYKIDLACPAARGEELSLKYTIEFAHKSTPLPELRRTAYSRVDSLSLHVEFHPERIPAQVWWCEWADWGPDAEIRREELVRLGDGRTASRCLQYIERAVVGFRWEW